MAIARSEMSVHPHVGSERDDQTPGPAATSARSPANKNKSLASRHAEVAFLPQTESTDDPSQHRVVIVGGGAAGLELATQLGEALGKKKAASITLVDRARTHMWKPLLHEVAAGSLDSDVDSVEFIPHAVKHG